MQIVTTFPYLLILGQDLVYWSGMLSGVFFLMLIVTAIIKQFNLRIWTQYQIPMTRLHHWFGWIAAGCMTIHLILAVLQFNFHIFF